MALTALSGLWLLNDHIFFSQTPLRSFYQHEIIIALALFVVFFGALIFYLIKSNDYKPNYAIMIGLLSVFIFLLVRLLVISPQTFNITAPGGDSYTFESHITSLERFKYCAQTFVTFALTFINSSKLTLKPLPIIPPICFWPSSSLSLFFSSSTSFFICSSPYSSIVLSFIKIC